MARSGASWSNARIRNVQNIKAQKCNTLPHPPIASAELPWLETTLFQKCMYISDAFWQSYKAHYLIKVLILWS